MDPNLIGGRGRSICMSNASLATSAVANSANRVNVANQVHYTIDGKFYRTPLTNNVALSSGHTAFSNNNVCVFALWIDSSAVFSTTQGEIVSSKEVEDDKRVVPLPEVVNDKALIGLIKVKAGVGATFTPQTTAFNATNINTTFLNVGIMPSTPFTDTVTAA